MSPGTLELQRILGTFVHSLFVSACTCLPLEMPLWVSLSSSLQCHNHFA